MGVVLYSTGCPKCNVLKQKLDSKSISYTENDSVDDMMALGITQVPVLLVGGERLSFQQANEWINKI
jgi:glutaredoxin